MQLMKGITVFLYVSTVFAEIVAQGAYFFERKIKGGHYLGQSLFPVLPPLPPWKMGF